MNSITPAHLDFLQRYGHQNYDDFGFDTGYFQELAALMGAPADVSLEGLALDHFEVVSAYFQSQQFDKYSVAIEKENQALQKAQDHITALMLTLDELNVTGKLGPRVYNELTEGNGSAFEYNGVRLSDLAGDEGAFIFENINSLLYDLQLALEHSKIRRFKTPPQIESTLRIRLTSKSDEERIQRDVASAALASQGEDPKARYKRLSNEFGKPREMPLLSFLHEFAVLWAKYSPLPFSESRYEPDARQYISRTVDAAQFCLKKLNADYPYNAVAKKVRTIRENL